MNKKKINNILEIMFTILWLLEGFLQTSCYTFENKLISFVLWPAVFIGGILLLINLFRYKDYLKDKKNWLLILFSCSFLISTLVMHKYGIYRNIRLLIFLLFQFFILYLYNKDNDTKEIESKLKIYMYLFLVGTFILTVVSMVHLVLGYSRIISKENVPDVVYGFTWGRLFGAYWDPNIASVICCVSLAILFYLIHDSKKIFAKILWILFAAMQVFYIVLSDSRTGRICLMVTVVSYAVFYFLKFLLDADYQKTKKFYVKMIVEIVCTIILSICLPSIVKLSYNKISSLNNKNIVEVIEIEKKGKKVKVIKERKKTTSKIGRGYDLEGDISNRRFDIWTSGFNIFKKNILTGVSRAHIVAYALDKMPKTYIVNNDQMDFSSMHNLYVDIIVSQGLFGITTFLLFIILSAINIIKNIKKIFAKSKYSIMFISIILTVFASTLVMTEIIYVDSPISTMFWIGLGYLNFLCINKEKKEL